MISDSKEPMGRFTLDDGSPAVGWTVASLRRRSLAWALDLGLLVGTLGVGWAIWTWRSWEHATTPGKAALGLTVFAIDTRCPATRARMALRTLVYRALAKVIGVVTLGLGWLYALTAATGPARRTLYDDWAQTIVLARPSMAGCEIHQGE
jgi:hypothetical protein